jgi:hypothetical protein
MSLSIGDTKGSLENRKLFLGKLGVDYRSLICAKQVHGVRIEAVTEKDSGKGALDYQSSVSDCDGFITDRPLVPVAILTADCLPVYIYDPKVRAVGVLHGGWRSSEANISGAGVKLIQDKFKSDPANLLVAFGPAMRACCYEVSADFKSNYPCALTKRAGKLYMDLAFLNKNQLIAAGVKEENISDTGLCTYCSQDEFFSFRREAALAGRMISVIMLKE